MAATDRWEKFNFYPRPPRGGRRKRYFDTMAEYLFLSTPSARRTTASTRDFNTHAAISIHALREEDDLLFHIKDDMARFISIHALREEDDLV